MNGFSVHPAAYFVYCNGRTDREAFDARLEFDITVLPYQGQPDWVPGALNDIKFCLMSPEIPAASSSCDWCAYRDAMQRHGVDG
jgi:hypothetical protein